MADYKEIMEDILELHKKYTVITGIIDIENIDGLGYIMSNKISIFDLIGRADVSLAEKEISSFEFNKSILGFKGEGEYYFKSIMTYENDEYDESGRIIYPGGYIMEYISVEFIQTFQQRNRNEVLDKILYSNNKVGGFFDLL